VWRRVRGVMGYLMFTSLAKLTQIIRLKNFGNMQLWETYSNHCDFNVVDFRQLTNNFRQACAVTFPLRHVTKLIIIFLHWLWAYFLGFFLRKFVTRHSRKNLWTTSY